MTDVRAESRRRRDRLAFWALAGFALFVAHDAVHLAQIGPGQALVDELRTAGHGYWGIASLALSAIAALAAALTLMRLRRLRRRASTLGAVPIADRSFARRFVGAWWRIGVIVAVGFSLQENAEHVVTHGHAIGAGALFGPEYPLALPVIGLIGAVAAAIATIVSGAQEALVTAIEAALGRAIRALRRVVNRRADAPARVSSVRSRPGAGRAPPSLVSSAT